MANTHSFESDGRKPNTRQAVNEVRLEAACPFAFTLRLLGARWRPAILWKVSEGVESYGGLKRSLPGVSDKMLAQDLTSLMGSGLLRRREVQRGRARSVAYSLTEAGSSLLPLLENMQRWGAAAMARTTLAA